MMLRSLCAGTLLAFAAPAAWATSCDTRRIAERSIDQTADDLLRYSDALGRGVVRDVSTHDVGRQEIEIIAPVKGEAKVYPLAPYQMGLEGRHDSMIRRFYTHPGEIRLFALFRTDNGYVGRTCVAASIAAKSGAALYRAAAARARAERR